MRFNKMLLVVPAMLGIAMFQSGIAHAETQVVSSSGASTARGVTPQISSQTTVLTATTATTSVVAATPATLTITTTSTILTGGGSQPHLVRSSDFDHT